MKKIKWMAAFFSDQLVILKRGRVGKTPFGKREERDLRNDGREQKNKRRSLGPVG